MIRKRFISPRVAKILHDEDLRRKLWSCNLVMLGLGCNFGWFSPSLPMLRSEHTPLDKPLTLEEIGWIGSLPSLIAIFSSIGFGLIVDRIGIKIALLLTAIPLACSWMFIIFATSATHILLSRAFCGIAAGGGFLFIPQFVAQIADSFIRGQLNAYMMVTFYGGVLLGFIGGTYLEYYTNQWVMMMIPVVFVCLFVFVPESPQFLLKKNNVLAAERSIRFYRNCKLGVAPQEDEDKLQLEFVKLQAIAKQDQGPTQLHWSDFVTRPAIKAFIVIPCLIIVSQFSGSFILNSYAATIFLETGSNIDAHVSSIILGVFQVLGNYSASQLVDKIGRRVLMMVSTTGSSLALSTTGVFVYLVRTGHDMSAYNFVPVVSLSFFIFICANGIVPIPFILIAELLPAKIRKPGATFFTCFAFFMQFVSLNIFPYVNAAIQLYGCMWMFTASTTFGLIFSFFVLKETSGKSLDVLEGHAPDAKAH